MAPATQSDHQREQVPRRRGSLALRLLGYSLPYGKLILLAVVLVLIVTALDLAGPLIIRHVIDGPLTAAITTGIGGDAAPRPGLSVEQAMRQLFAWAGVYVVIVVIYIFLRYGQSMLMSFIGKKVMNDVRMQVFEHLQRMPLAFFDRNPVGRLVTRVSNDVEALNQLFTSGVVTFLADIIVLVGITIILFTVNSSLALITISVVPLLLIVTFVFRFFARRFYREQRTHLANLNAFTQESIQGMDIIHLFVQEENNLRRFQGINKRYLDTFLKTVFCYSIYFPGLEIISAAAQVGILLWGGSLIGAGELTFGEFYLFWKFLTRFFNPIRDMAERYNVMQSALMAAERIFQVLDSPESIRNRPQAIPPTSLRGKVEFDRVSFAYNDVDYAIRDLSFQIEPGETVAIVGATGSGKSTVVNLMTRFYEPQHGRILIDGVDLQDYDKHALRRRMALVLQDPFLFTTTMSENIRLGNPDISKAMVLEAAERVNADRFIRKLPGQYLHILMERGATLSVGERQLISFARALAHDPDILILDEATSHIDTETEKLIQSALDELLSGRTSIVIAHRLSTIQKADRILVLHKGKLRELGTHRELLEMNGIYFRLHELQFPAGTAGK